MAERRVYLDNSATTPVDPRVAAAMARAVVETFGNASSVHGFGQQARAAVDRSRREVAALIAGGAATEREAARPRRNGAPHAAKLRFFVGYYSVKLVIK